MIDVGFGCVLVVVSCVVGRNVLSLVRWLSCFMLRGIFGDDSRLAAVRWCSWLAVGRLLCVAGSRCVVGCMLCVDCCLSLVVVGGLLLVVCFGLCVA